LVEHITKLYKEIYQLGKKASKQDRFGLLAKTELLILNCLELSLEATYSRPDDKIRILNRLQIKIEVFKRLARLAGDLKIIEQAQYLSLAQQGITISKMTAGWLKYLDQKNR